MSVDTSIASVTVIGDGNNTSFPFTDLDLQASSSELAVYLIDTDGTVTQLEEGTGTDKYNVTVASYPGDGTVTYPSLGTGRLSSSQKLVMKREEPFLQGVDLGFESGYSSSVQETLHDGHVMRDIQQQEEIDRSIKVPMGSDVTAEEYLQDITEDASAQAVAAAASATSASASATAASGSVTSASTQATNAAASAVAAAASAVAAAASAASLNGTSATSLAIATGSKVFTTQAGKQFNVGAFVIAASAANVSNYMFGQVTAYSSTTLTVNVTVIGGSGTKTDWLISVAGSQGATGPAGPTGSGSGDVNGPASSVSANVATFNGTSGKTIQDSGVALGTMASQGAGAVAITGGTIAGITDLAVADGGTGSSTAANARTALGLAIGTDVQAFSAKTAAITALTWAANKFLLFTSSSACAVSSISADAISLLAAADFAAMRTLLGLSGAVATGAYMPFAGASAPSGYLLCDGSAVSRSTYSGLFAVCGTTYGIGDGSTTFNLPDLRGFIPAGKDDMGGSPAGRLSIIQNGNTHNASTTVDTLSSTALLSVGMKVVGTGIQAGTTITTIVSATNITLSLAATATATVSLRFGIVDGATLGSTGGAQSHANTIAETAAHTHPGVTTVTTSNSPKSIGTGVNLGVDDTNNTGSTGNGRAHPTLPPVIITNYIIKT